DSRQGLDAIHIVHEPKWRRFRAHDDASREKSHDDRQPDPLADPPNRTGDDQYDRQVLNKMKSVHGDAAIQDAAKRAVRQVRALQTIQSTQPTIRPRIFRQVSPWRLARLAALSLAEKLLHPARHVPRRNRSYEPLQHAVPALPARNHEP